MNRREGQVIDEYGRPVPGAYVYVFSSSGDPAYLTADGSVPLRQPIDTDEFGVYSYYATEEFYREDTYFSGKLRYREVVPVGLSPATLIEAAHDAEVARAGAEAAEAGTLAALAGASLSAVILNAASRTVLAALDHTLGLPAYLTEVGREGVFVWNGTNLSVLVTADSAQGLFVAPSSDTTGASGAWVRQFKGPAHSNWWGVSTSNPATTNRTALNAADATLNAIKVSGSTFASSSIGLHTPAGVYNVDNSASAITPSHPYEISGDFLGGFDGDGTVFLFNSTAHHGFDLPAATPGLAGTTFRGLYLKGVAVNQNNATNNAINAHHRIHVENVTGEHWAGDVCFVWGDVASGQGNANSCTFRNVSGLYCGWTVHLKGGDTNACVAQNVGGVVNRFGAWLDASGLGGSLTGGIAESCGITAGFVTRSEKSGHVYMVAFGQEAWCSTNGPTGDTTSNQGWIYFGDDSPASVQPTWTTGQTWYFASPFCVAPDSLSSRGQILGVYIETNCNRPIIGGNATFFPAFNILPVYTTTGAPTPGYMYKAGTFMAFGDGVSARQVQSTGLSESLNPSDYGFSHNRSTNPGRAGYHLYNGGGVREWRVYQPDHATDDHLHIASYAGGVEYIHATLSYIDHTWDMIGGIKVNGNQVISNRQSAISDPALVTAVTVGGTAQPSPTQAEYNTLVGQFNVLRSDVINMRNGIVAILAALRPTTGHGLISP